MKDFWNERYSEPGYAYGTEPNIYFKESLKSLSPGRILMVAEGEGRNAVYAAVQGWEVFALDSSEAGKKKALQLANSRNVKIQYQVTDVLSVQYPENHFNCIALIFAHFPPDIRTRIHQKLTTFLKPTGNIILEAFSKIQLDNSSGGPKNIELLYDLTMLEEDFFSLSNKEILEMETTLNEGLYHQGKASIIRLFGEK